jgi:hypothetical protein
MKSFNEGKNRRYPAKHICEAVEAGEKRISLPGRIDEENGEYLFYAHTVPEQHPSGDGSVRYPLCGRRIGIQRLEKAVNTMLQKIEINKKIKFNIEDKYDEEIAFRVLVAEVYFD